MNTDTLASNTNRYQLYGEAHAQKPRLSRQCTEPAIGLLSVVWAASISHREVVPGVNRFFRNVSFSSATRDIWA